MNLLCRLLWLQSSRKSQRSRLRSKLCLKFNLQSKFQLSRLYLKRCRSQLLKLMSKHQLKYQSKYPLKFLLSRRLFHLSRWKYQ